MRNRPKEMDGWILPDVRQAGDELWSYAHALSNDDLERFSAAGFAEPLTNEAVLIIPGMSTDQEK